MIPDYSNKGWECPKCGTVFSPYITRCDNPECVPIRLEFAGKTISGGGENNLRTWEEIYGYADYEGEE